MPQIQLNAQSLAGWPGAGRNDLPPYNQFANLVNDETSNVPVAPLGAFTGKAPHASTPAVHNLTYQYVDTGKSAIHLTNVLWSDSASWCTIVTLWRMGRAGLAHVIPGALAANDTTAFLNLYGPAVPDEIHLVTTPASFLWCGQLSYPRRARSSAAFEPAGPQITPSGNRGRGWAFWATTSVCNLRRRSDSLSNTASTRPLSNLSSATRVALRC